jgi:hypothetical protein
MATKKGKGKKGTVKVGKLKVKTTKANANELKKVKGGAEYSFTQAWPKKYTG